jgi:hypothetical protein
MTCYKCGGDKELSIKARHRDGSVRALICRPCRRKAYHAAPPSQAEPEIMYTAAVIEWRRRARASVASISKRAREGAWATT